MSTMATTYLFPRKKNLLLCLDAFGTLFTPSIPIPVAYARAAARHGINVGDTENPREVASRFKEAFKRESRKNPNYGKATDMRAERWWGNIIQNTFAPFLKPNQRFPQALTKELIQTYSSSDGYTLYSDVMPFFTMLRKVKREFQTQTQTPSHTWPWTTTIVGVVTNSDSRIPAILSSFALNVSARRHKAPTTAAIMKAEDADINFIILSYDVGAEKPDAAIFKAAEEMLGDEAREFEKLHVGDDLEKDYFGAEDAGWGRLLLRRSVGENESGVRHVQVEDEQGITKTVDAVDSLLELGSWRSKQQT